MSVPSERVFDRVVVIMFENEYRNYVKAHPYMRWLAAQGTEMASYFGVMHPSNTNYVASIAGEICNISADPFYYTLMPSPVKPAPGPAPFDKRSVVDLLTERGLGWKAYMETYYPVTFPPQLDPVMMPPVPGAPPTVDQPATVKHTVLDYPPYLNLHNPFVRFKTVFENESQWKRIGTSNDFFRDAMNNTLPEYSWFTPDIWGDGHWLFGSYTEPAERGPILVNQLAKWLEDFFGVLNFPGPNSRLPKGTLVVVTFDEADFNQSYETVQADGSDYDGPNQIYTVLLGDMIEPARREFEGYNHYSLLRTVEKNFDLASLGKNDAASNWFQFLWKQRFQWSAPAATPIASASCIAAASLDDTLYVVTGQSDGTLAWQTYAAGGWSGPTAIAGPAGVTAIALASCNGQLVLVCQSGTGLGVLTYSATSGWSAMQSIVSEAGSFALAAYLDYGAQTENVMLAYQTPGTNAIVSQIYAGGSWAAPVQTGHSTDGGMTLAVLGPSLFLIHKATGSNELNVVTYNTADFNVVTIAPGNASNTTSGLWSPSEFPVSHFGAGPNRVPQEKEPVLMPYQGVTPFVCATLEGVIHLAHPAVDQQQIMCETFSIGGVMTPATPVSYAKNTTGNSNGYGTLAEAGWSRQVPIEGSSNAGCMAMARAGAQVAMLFQPEAGGPISITLGAYQSELRARIRGESAR